MPLTSLLAAAAFGCCGLMLHAAPSPAKTSPVLLYAGTGSAVSVYTQKGKLTSQFATSTGAEYLAMDDAGDVFVDYGLGSSMQTQVIARYAIGGNAPAALYEPTQNTFGGVGLVQASHAGELVYSYFTRTGSVLKPFVNVWDAGATGKPSRTFKPPTGNFVATAIAPNGDLYLYNRDVAKDQIWYDVIPPGTSKPSKIIRDTLVPKRLAQGYGPNFMAVASDGTLYVGEWTFDAGDGLAGLYVYPPSGPQMLVTTGVPDPTGLGIDAAGNVYVLNSNSVFTDQGWTCDTVHTVSVYSPGAKALLRQVTSGLTNGASLTVGANGLAALAEYPYAYPDLCPSSPQGVGGIASIAPKATMARAIVANTFAPNVVMYDGHTATNPATQAMR